MKTVTKINNPSQSAKKIAARAIKAAGILFMILSSLSVSSQIANENRLSHLTLHPAAVTQQKGSLTVPMLYPKFYTVFLAQSFPVIESSITQVLHKMDDGESFDYEGLFFENKDLMTTNNIKQKKNTKTKTKTGPKLNYKL